MSVSSLNRMFKKGLRSSRRIAARLNAGTQTSPALASREYHSEPPLGFQSRASHSFFVR